MRVSAFLIFVLMLGCGKTDSAKSGKGGEVGKVGADVMKSGVSEVPDDSMSGSRGAKGTGGTGAKADTGPGNASNPAVVKNDGKTAKPVTPVVKKETPVWDWPVKAKYDIPKCRKLYFHNENLVSDIHRGNNTVMVYRYRDGKLEFKKDIWVGNELRLRWGEYFWPLPDGKIMYTADSEKYTADGGLNWEGSENNIFIINEKITEHKSLYNAYATSNGYRPFTYLKNKGDLVYFQHEEKGNVGAYWILSIDYKNGKIKKKQKIKDLESDELYDWALGNVDNYNWPSTNRYGSLYKNKKRVVRIDISVFDNTTTYKVAAGECLFGKADILIAGKNEKNPTSLYDEELKKIIKPHCKKAPLVFVNKYRIQNRPGGGFVVNFTIGVKPLDRRYLAKAGSYYREYSGEGKPIGPVIKTQSEVEILSENHYRVTEGCHYEYRHRPVTK
ncbi:hypothetical protein KKF34_00765 [Myxococcota bacterium]|nr:hypothetical protein [Myxococcota bacterium]MBU1495393.1 hypothetical protein [Myxococcota bacterium]